MDIVYLRGLKIETIVGIYAWERQMPRPLVFDLELGTDIRAAAASDRVEDAVNYAAVAEYVTDSVQSQQPALLEPLLENLAQGLFERFNIQWLRLSVDKPGAVAGLKAVGLRIERSRDGRMPSDT